MTILARNHEPEFPYVHQEYPKWVKTPEGKDVIVDSLEEEEALLPIPEAIVDDTPPAEPKGKKGSAADESLA